MAGSLKEQSTRTVRAILLFFLAVAWVGWGCGGHHKATSSSSATIGALAGDPVAAIKGVLPKRWTVLKVQEHTFPFYLPEGDGTLIVAGDPSKHIPSGKPRAQFQIWIMPLNYQDGGQEPFKEMRQTYPPQLLATGKNAKVYEWGVPPELFDDLIRVLFR